MLMELKYLFDIDCKLSNLQKQSTILDRTLVPTQLLVHYIGISKNKRNDRPNQVNMLCRYILDGGLPWGIVIAFNMKSFILNSVKYVGMFTLKKTEVIHLVHAWPE